MADVATAKESHEKCNQITHEPLHPRAPAPLAPPRRVPLPTSQSPMCFRTCRVSAVGKISATGTPTRVARVRAEYPDQHDYSGSGQTVLAQDLMHRSLSEIFQRGGALQRQHNEQSFGNCPLRNTVQRHQWSSGGIQRCHRCDTGSIPN